MKVEVFIVTCKSYDTDPSVCISVDNKRFIFNTPDQTQRALQQANIKLSTVKCVCNTSLSNHSYAGFMGLCYEMFFEVQQITFPVLTSKDVYQLVDMQTTFDGDKSHVPPLLESYDEEETSIKRIDLKNSCCFIVEVDPKKCAASQKTNFDAQKAIALGVPKGPMLKKLQNGESITLSDGNVITPEMCKKDEDETRDKTVKILVVECTTLEDLSLIPDVTGFNAVIHFSSDEFLHNESYISFFKGAQHNLAFFMDGRISFIKGYEYFESNRKKYSELDSLAMGEQPKEEETKPYECYSHGTVVSFYPKESIRSTYKPAKAPVYMPKEVHPFDKISVEILGTIAGITQQSKTTASIIVLTHYGNIILDAGEGFIYQLRRKYGHDIANQILKDTVCIWTSHYHWDHIGGLYSLAQERGELTSREIPLYTDKHLIEELQAIETLHKENFHLQYHVKSTEEFKYAKEDFSMVLSPCPVEHCPGSMGCVVEFRFGEEKIRLAYSGDHHTEDGFVDFVKNADILIHEATKGPRLDAHEKRDCHSSIHTAEIVGEKLGAKLTVLTHISKRFANKIIETTAPTSMFAFDFITIRPENINDLIKSFDKICV